MSTVSKHPSRDIVWACCFAGIDALQSSPHIHSRHTEGQLSRWNKPKHIIGSFMLINLLPKVTIKQCPTKACCSVRENIISNSNALSIQIQIISKRCAIPKTLYPECGSDSNVTEGISSKTFTFKADQSDFLLPFGPVTNSFLFVRVVTLNVRHYPLQRATVFN